MMEDKQPDYIIKTVSGTVYNMFYDSIIANSEDLEVFLMRKNWIPLRHEGVYREILLVHNIESITFTK